MIVYFRRRTDGAIITRELAEAAGVAVRLSPPANAEQIEPAEALAELDRLDAERLARRRADADRHAQARAGAYAELLALGLSPAAATALSGHPGGADGR